MSALLEVLADPSIKQEFAELHPIRQTVINWQLDWLENKARSEERRVGKECRL